MGQDARCPDGRAWTLLRIDTSDGYLFFDQRRRAANDVPEWLRTNTPVDVAGHQGYRLTEHGVEYLVWARDGILALLESDTAPFEELLRMAESARLR